MFAYRREGGTFCQVVNVLPLLAFGKPSCVRLLTCAKMRFDETWGHPCEQVSARTKDR